MDARFFSPANVSDEEKEYQFIVTLKGNGKCKEKEHTLEKAASADISKGKLSFSKSTSTFKGKSLQKNVSFGIGQDKKDGHVGLVKSSLDTSLIKDAMRSHLKSQGWKKAGLFG